MVERYSRLKRSSLANVEGILPILVVLNEMVEDHVIQNFAIGGGFATSLHDVPYTTEDIDVFCSFGVSTSLIDPSPIFKYLQERGAKWVGHELKLGTWPIEFIPPTSKLSEEALEKAQTVTISGVTTRIFTPEYLVAVALETNRPKDKLKALELYQHGKINESLLRGLLSRYDLLSRWEALNQ